MENVIGRKILKFLHFIQYCNYFVLFSAIKIVNFDRQPDVALC